MGKNYIESSLKRFLKRKVKITIGFVVAFMITGSIGFAEGIAKIDKSVTGIQNYTSNIEITSTEEIEGVGRIAGIYSKIDSPVKITGKNITINMNDKKDVKIGLAGVYGVTGSKLEIVVDNLIINSKSEDGNSASGIFLQKDSEAIMEGDVNISAITNTIKLGKKHESLPTGLASMGKNALFSGENFNLYTSSINSLNYNNGALGIQVSSNSVTDESLTNFNYKNMNVIAEGYGNGTVEAVKVLKNGKVIFNNDVTNITAKSNRYAQGLVLFDGKAADFLKGDINIKAELVNTPDGMPISDNLYAAKAILLDTLDGSAKVTFDKNVGNVVIEAHGAGKSKYNYGEEEERNETAGIVLNGGSIEASSKNFQIIVSSGEAKGKGYATITGILLSNGNGVNNNINIGENTKTKVLVDSFVEDSIGISIEKGSTIFNGKAEIKSNSTVGNATAVRTFGENNLAVFNNDTVISAIGKIKSEALLAKDSGKINIIGKDKLVQVTGDINAETKGTISANLSTSDSFITGTITDNSQDVANKGTVNIGMDNGAVWNNTGNSFVTELTLNNGVINNDSVDNNISVGTLKGNGGAVNMAAAIDKTTGEATSGELNIGTVENKNARFAVNYKGTDNLEVDKEKAEKVFKDLAKNITVDKGEFNANAKLEEGFVSREYTSEFVKDNTGDVVVKENSVKIGNLNSMVEGMRDLATINLLTWRQEMNSLNKRMGELRNSTGENGVWSRVYTGKIENGSKYDNDYQTYQVGYDKKYTVDNGVMFVGGLVSYTDGETDYALGHGENYSVGAGIYATWLNNDGQFADVVLKQSRLHNKFDVRSKDLDKSQSGDYNNWGTSLSGQYGKRFDLNDKFFVEPSVELTLGRVDDTTYTTSAGVDVHQDTMYSLVGNVGTSVGYKFNDKGNVYARAALVKEFQGDIDTEYKKDGALERTSEDLGDTWAEFGVGVNYRFVENMNVYIDIQKTGEAAVDNKWQANLGFRYEF